MREKLEKEKSESIEQDRKRILESEIDGKRKAVKKKIKD